MPYPYVLSEAERDWRIQCADYPDPPKAPTCGDCDSFDRCPGDCGWGWCKQDGMWVREDDDDCHDD